jgi:hypothetical protein
MQAQKWSRGIAPLICKLGDRLGERSRRSPDGYDIWKEFPKKKYEYCVQKYPGRKKG